MNLTITKKDFLRLLTRCQGVASKKATMPALSAVLMTTKGSVLRVDATDAFLVVTDVASAEVAEAGTCAVNARDLYVRVAAMPEGPLKVSLDKKGTLTIKSGGSSPRKFTLATIAASDFPEIPTIEETAPRLAIPPADLLRLIDLAKVSISIDETRAHINSGLFEWSAGRLRMVSTNGHMLSVADLAIANETTASMLVPLRALTEVQKLASGHTDPITMRPAGSRLFFDVGSARFGVKLVEAQFPPYQQVIPKSSPRTLKIARIALIEALSAVRLSASSTTHAIKFTVSKDVLRITSESPDAGQSFDEVPYEGAFVGEQAYGFAAHYVIDTLSAMKCDAVEIGLNGELDPMTVKPESANDHLAVIMPMKI